MPRYGDYDGRGNLSNRMLSEFVNFGIECGLDQVGFMQRTFDFAGI